MMTVLPMATPADEEEIDLFEAAPSAAGNALGTATAM